MGNEEKKSCGGEEERTVYTRKVTWEIGVEEVPANVKEVMRGLPQGEKKS